MAGSSTVNSISNFDDILAETMEEFVWKYTNKPLPTRISKSESLRASNSSSNDSAWYVPVYNTYRDYISSFFPSFVLSNAVSKEAPPKKSFSLLEAVLEEREGATQSVFMNTMTKKSTFLSNVLQTLEAAPVISYSNQTGLIIAEGTLKRSLPSSSPAGQQPSPRTTLSSGGQKIPPLSTPSDISSEDAGLQQMFNELFKNMLSTACDSSTTDPNSSTLLNTSEKDEELTSEEAKSVMNLISELSNALRPHLETALTDGNPITDQWFNAFKEMGIDLNE